jgi:hypothetical protein
VVARNAVIAMIVSRVEIKGNENKAAIDFGLAKP